VVVKIRSSHAFLAFEVVFLDEVVIDGLLLLIYEVLAVSLTHVFI